MREKFFLSELSKVSPEEIFNLVERNGVEIVIKVDVIRAGDNQQLLVADDRIVAVGARARHVFEGVFAEISGVRFFAVNHQNGRLNFGGVSQ